MKHTQLFLSILLALNFPVPGWSKKNNTVQGQQTTQVLIVGLNNNVKSNYYYNDMIAEATGMKADSIDQQYNYVIAQNIAAAGANGLCHFITSEYHQSYPFIEKIEVIGEGETCTSSLVNVSETELQQTLTDAHADYLLVLNQHYLKWQGQPMRTIFHIISYSLYDKDKKQVLSGNQYFTCMDLERPDRIIQISRKSTSKIASSVARYLDL